jgi:hypothetical protein
MEERKNTLIDTECQRASLPSRMANRLTKKFTLKQNAIKSFYSIKKERFVWKVIKKTCRDVAKKKEATRRTECMWQKAI